jgi:hypothetical protein
MTSAVAIIDVDIEAGHDEEAREVLLERLREYQESAIAPLWINLMRERADLRIACLVRDAARLDDFLMDVVRVVPGVRGTSARLAFAGAVRADVIAHLPAMGTLWTRRASAPVFVRIQPGRDREVYDALRTLPPHRQVHVGWVLKLFHSPLADIQLLLISDTTTALTGYMMSWVRTVPGVLDTEMITVLDWQMLGPPEAFAELAERFAE